MRESQLAGARSFILDNGLLTLSVLPEYGGRICSLFYRPLNREWLATEFRPGTRGAPMLVRGGWYGAFPSLLADGEITSHESWEAEIVEQRDERVSLRLWCLVDRISHEIDGRVRMTPATILCERFITLEAGEPAVTVDDVLTNRSPWPMPTTWSAVLDLQAQAGDRAILPVEGVEVQRGVGPTGNEIDFGMLVATPYQAFARDLREGWIGFRPAGVPADLRLSFPRDVLPHAVIVAQRGDERPHEDILRLQPIATPGPIASDTRGGALVLPSQEPYTIPLRLEIGTQLIPAGAWSRPGMQLAELITAQRMPPARVALWRVGHTGFAVKTGQHLLLLMPEFAETDLLAPEDLPGVDLILCDHLENADALARLAQRSQARFVGPPPVRQALLARGISEDRVIALSAGARVDFPGLGILATPAHGGMGEEERLGFLLQIDHLTLYHTGRTEFLSEFGTLAQFHPQLVLLPLGALLPSGDAFQAARLLQPRLVVPLGTEEEERQFIRRCRDQHAAFAAQIMRRAEGIFFDGWHLRPVE